MFDFAIAHNQRHRPTKRLCLSVVASCLLHLGMLVVLMENPWLLQGGFYNRFRGLVLTADSMDSPTDLENEKYRTIAILGPMVTPPDDVLKGLIYNWDKPKEENAGTSQSVQARWGSEDKTAPDEDISVSTKTTTTPKPAPAGEAEASDLASNRDLPSQGNVEQQPAPAESASIAPEPAPRKKAAPDVLPPAEKETIAANIAPAKIPDRPPTSQSAAKPESIKSFKNEEQAIRESGSGIFDDRGFPLDEYASRIKQLVTRNWYIPSNLRGSNGYTTIIFYIDRDGKYFNVRIVESSGNNSLNLTAMNAIISSSPFPPLPKGFPGDHVGVKYVFIPQAQ